MRHRIVWITVWLTLVLWFGQAWAAADEGASPLKPATAAMEESAPNDGGTGVITQPKETSGAGVVHSVLNRNHWPVLAVTSEDGRTHHGPTWLRSKQPTAAQMPRLEGRYDPATLEISLARSSPSGWGASNLAALGDETVRLLVSVATLPVKMLISEPVWKTETTP